ncbi:MAG: PEP-CTERM sorting domain-containing protein [Bryobacteraceae bacterium]
MKGTLAIWLILSGIAATAYAGSITTFTDRTVFDTAVGPTTTETFGSQLCFPLTAPLNNASSYSCLPAGTIQLGATYSAPIVTGNSFNIDSGGGFPTPFLDSLLEGRAVGAAPLTVTFTSPLAAVGFDTNNIMGSVLNIEFNFISGNQTLNPGISGTQLQFFGFQSSAADIVSVVISGNSSGLGFAVDNFSFGGAAGEASSVPEPSTVLPVTGGLLWLYGSIRRRRCAHSPKR